jgi:hypothetical protein
MYQLGTLLPSMTEHSVVIRLSDKASIPFDEANTDYQAYLKWVAESNTPLPAENE